MTISRINGPSYSKDEPEYNMECLDALRPSFESLVELAEAAKWHPYQVALCLLWLGIAHFDTIERNASADRHIVHH